MSATMIFACTTFVLFEFFPWGIPPSQSDWSLSCDHGRDCEVMREQQQELLAHYAVVAATSIVRFIYPPQDTVAVPL